MTADIKTKVADIKSLMISNDMGKGMKGCEKLLSQHAAAEADLGPGLVDGAFQAD